MHRTKIATLLLVGLVLGLAGERLVAEGSKPFQIATGAETGTYQTIGAIIARSVSASDMALTAVTSKGSVANVQAIVARQIKSGLSESDVASWAFTGTGAFDGKPALDLRAIAHLYPGIHSYWWCAEEFAGIQSIADLRDKRVSLDEEGSGTLAEARLLLDAWGIKEADVRGRTPYAR